MSRVGETGVGEMGIGETGVGEMGVGEMGPNHSNSVLCYPLQILCSKSLVSIFKFYILK